MRPDHIKLHIKEYGHYGPHCSITRPRLPGSAGRRCKISAQVIRGPISALYEEWLPDETGGARRILQTYILDPSKTKIWHEDVTGEAFRRSTTHDQSVRYHCSEPGCYYALPPPEGVEEIGFTSSSALSEHYRRSHRPFGQSWYTNTETTYPSIISQDKMDIPLVLQSIDSSAFCTSSPITPYLGTSSTSSGAEQQSYLGFAPFEPVPFFDAIDTDSMYNTSRLYSCSADRGSMDLPLADCWNPISFYPRSDYEDYSSSATAGTTLSGISSTSSTSGCAFSSYPNILEAQTY